MFQYQKTRWEGLLWLLLLSSDIVAQNTTNDTRPISENEYTAFVFSRQFTNNTFEIITNPTTNEIITISPSVPTLDLVWKHAPGPQLSGYNHAPDGLYDTVSHFQDSFTPRDSLVTLYDRDGNDCADGLCSGRSICNPRYYCLWNVTLYMGFGDVNSFYDCLCEKFGISWDEQRLSSWQCGIIVTSYSLSHQYSCTSHLFDLTAENWNQDGSDIVDRNLQTAITGGVDDSGYYWEGRREGETLAEAIGRQFWNILGNKCTLDNPCLPVLDCNRIGSFTAISMGTTNQAAQLPWVLLASSAFKNINQQLVNQYSELKDAIESLALDAFSIDDFYPEKAQDFSLLNSLTGLSGIFTIVGGFVPTVGPAIEAAGTIASAVGTFLTNSASSNDPLEAQKVFSQKVLTYYRGLLSAMEDIVLKLFAGDSIPGPGPGSFNITDMMKNGSWVNPNVVTRVSDLNRKIRTEILARSIDSLWKTPTQNKMWVLFKDLEDDASQSKCENDKTGPQDSIYCADGGVYYTYNFIEVKGEGGGVGWPWGADKLEKTVNITMKAVTEASAKSYRLMKDTGGDPFNFTQTNGTAAFLFSAFTPRSSPSDYNNTDLSESVGRFPGSWTLPVCDISTWNYEWNWDYTQANFDSKGAYWTHPPCLCGPQALETFDWAKAAGMQEFQTFWDRCEQVLHHENFVWPDGVTFVNYPDKDGKQITIRKR